METTILEPTNIERDLAEAIHLNLHALSKFEEPRQEYLDCFTSSTAVNLILNINQKALLELLHYLFKLIEHKEFAKRFIWPVYDKRTEAEFRSSAIDYLNILKLKHSLRYETVKTYILVKPNGYRFLVIIYDLTMLIMQEEVRKFKAEYPDETCIELFGEMKLRQNHTIQQLKAKQKYIGDLKANTAQITTETKRMQSVMANIFPSDEVNDQSVLLKQWSQQLNTCIDTNITPHFERITRINDGLTKLWKTVERLFDERQRPIVTIASEDYFPLEPNGDINFGKLLQSLESLLPTLSKLGHNYQCKSMESLRYEGECIRQLYDKILATDARINVMVHEINTIKLSAVKQQPVQVEVDAAHDTFAYKLMSTPSIKCETGQSSVRRSLSLNTQQNLPSSNVSNSITLKASVCGAPLNYTPKVSDPTSLLKRLQTQSAAHANNSLSLEWPLTSTTTLKLFQPPRFGLSPRGNATTPKKSNADASRTFTSPSGRLTALVEYDEEFLKIIRAEK